MAKGKKKPPAKPQAKPSKAISPLAPKSFAHLPPLAGVRLATGEAGIKYKDRTDVLLAMLAPGTEVAGVFTKSKTASAPVEWCRTQLKRGQARALVVNSGNANAFTGQAGQAGVRAVAEGSLWCAGLIKYRVHDPCPPDSLQPARRGRPARVDKGHGRHRRLLRGWRDRRRLFRI